MGFDTGGAEMNVKLTKSQRNLLEILKDHGGFLLVPMAGWPRKLIWCEKRPEKHLPSGSFLMLTLDGAKSYIEYPLPDFEFITYENSPWSIDELLKMEVE